MSNLNPFIGDMGSVKTQLEKLKVCYSQQKISYISVHSQAFSFAGNDSCVKSSVYYDHTNGSHFGARVVLCPEKIVHQTWHDEKMHANVLYL